MKWKEKKRRRKKRYNRKIMRRERRSLEPENLSVIIPAYKADRYIEKCLNSILSQDDMVEEILVGVDNCKDTLNKLNRLGLPSKVKVFWFKRSYPYVIRNTLAKKAKSSNLFFFDADDWLLPGSIDRIAKALKRNDLLKMRYYQVWDKCFYDNMNPDFDYDEVSSPHWPRDYGISNQLMEEHQKPRVAGGVIAVKRHIFLENNGFYPWICGADSQFTKRLKTKVRYGELSEPVFVRRLHKNSITTNEDTGRGGVIRESIPQKKGNPNKLHTEHCVNNLHTLSVIVTSQCQNKCNSCAAAKWLERNRNYHLTLQQLGRWIKANEESGYEFSIVRLSGGEPLLWNNLIPGVKMLREHKEDMTISMISNGQAATPGNKEKLSEMFEIIDLLNVSNYGLPKRKIDLLKQLGGDKVILKDKEDFYDATSFYNAPTNKRIEELLPAYCKCPGVSLIGDRIFVCADSIWMFDWREHDVDWIHTQVSKGYMDRLPLDNRGNYAFCSQCIANQKVRDVSKTIKSQD